MQRDRETTQRQHTTTDKEIQRELVWLMRLCRFAEVIERTHFAHDSWWGP